MIVYIAVDDTNGMMFNHRRQSQDRIMRQNMLKDCADSTLWIGEYSRRIFSDENGNLIADNIVVDDDFLSKAGENDHCFSETTDITPWMDKIDTLVLYKWNKRYPADTYFDTSLLDTNWKKFSLNHFKGSSHDKIFKEVWKRV